MEEILTNLNIIQNDKYKYKKYVPQFDKITKNMKININTHQGQKKFGKACSFYVNSRKDNNVLKYERVRYYIFLVLKILIISFLLFLIIINLLNIQTNSKLIKKIANDTETFLFMFLGVIFIYFFFPVFPKPIISETDVKLAFSAGIALLLIGIMRFFKLKEQKKKEEEIIKQSQKNKKEAEELLKKSQQDKQHTEDLLKQIQKNEEKNKE